MYPEFAPGWNNLGVALARLGRLERAEQSYRRAIALDPALASAERNLWRLAQAEEPASPEPAP